MIFPDDQNSEKPFHVEKTLQAMNTVKRAKQIRFWRYLKDTSLPDVCPDTPQAVRTFYEARADAPVENKGDTWAVWIGEGEPTEPAFDEYKTPDGLVEVFPKTPGEKAQEVFPVTQVELLSNGEVVHGWTSNIELLDDELNRIGHRLYELSEGRDPSLSGILLRISDILHAEANKIAIARMRKERK